MDALALAAIVAVAALALRQSWGKWLHPIIDAGRDLYVPEQILLGEKLYRDVLYFYPPLTPYLLAAITAVTGSSLAIYAVVGIAISAVACGALYAAARAGSGRSAAFSVALLFVSASLAGATAYGSNFVFPYAHAAILAMTLFIIFEAMVLRIFAEGASAGRTAVAIGAAVLCAWCKIEFAIFVAVSIVAFALLAAATRRVAPGKALVAAGVAFGILTASFAAVWRYFDDAPPGHHWLFDNTLPAALLSGDVARHFYSSVTGIDHWASNLTVAAVGLALIVAHAMLVRSLDRNATPGERPVVTVALLVGLALVVYVLGNDRFFRAWTLIQIGLLPGAVRAVIRVVRSPEHQGKWEELRLPLLLWFSLCGTSRIYLNLAPSWYGFFLILPVWLLIADVLFRELPARGLHSRKGALLWLPLLIVIAGRNLTEQRETYAKKSFAIETPRGTFYDANPYRAQVLSEFFAYTREHRLAGFVVIPEGLALNYAASIPNPTSWHTFTPAELPTITQERAAIAEFERARPQHVAVASRDASDFGFRGFGIDYGIALDGYLRTNYVLERQWRTEGFSLFLLRRR
ncbi:MAG: hypothetical protein NDJ92_14795 [Thermoanaerobaculia bacterium]|nr:hypothetical protein [Thermoanaerobaculia bacterium]